MAVSVPVFTSQLEKSRDATTVSNLRSAYAEAQSAYLMYDGKGTSQTVGNATITAASGQVTKIDIANVVTKGVQTGFEGNIQEELPFTLPTSPDLGAAANTYTITFNYGTNGQISSVGATAKTGNG